MAYQHLSVFPAAIENVVRSVGSLSEAAFAGLLAEIRSPEGFDLGDRRVARVAERIGTTGDDARAIIGTIGYMYGQIHRRSSGEVGDADLAAVIRRDLFAQEDEEDGQLISRLVLLLRRDPSIDDSRALARLRTGLLPKAISFASYVDLRPDLGAAGGTVERLAPIVQFRIVTDASDERARTHVFQVDPRSLDDLEDAIRSARDRLSALKNSPQLAKLIAD